MATSLHTGDNKIKTSSSVRRRNDAHNYLQISIRFLCSDRSQNAERFHEEDDGYYLKVSGTGQYGDLSTQVSHTQRDL